MGVCPVRGRGPKWGGLAPATAWVWPRSSAESHHVWPPSAPLPVPRARPGSGGDHSIVAVARLFATAPHRVRAWRSRFLAGGRPGLADEPRTGRPPKLDGAALSPQRHGAYRDHTATRADRIKVRCSVGPTRRRNLIGNKVGSSRGSLRASASMRRQRATVKHGRCRNCGNAPIWPFRQFPDFQQTVILPKTPSKVGTSPPAD